MQIKKVKIHLLEPIKINFPDYHEFPGAQRAESFNIEPGLVRIFTDDGLEGNFLIEDHSLAMGLIKPLKRMLIGIDPLDKEKFFGHYPPTHRRGLGTGTYWSWPTFNGDIFLCVIDVCMWDIIGKYFKMPIYRLLGACREKVLAYASTHHLKSVKEYLDTAEKCLEEGFKAIKIHTPSTLGFGDWKHDIEVCRAVRDLVGDDVKLLLDPYVAYDRRTALKVGREIQRLDFCAYEDPLPTSDIDGYVELCRELDVNIWCGEFLQSLYQYSEYIRRGATDAVRCSMENVGGVTPLMKVAHLAEAFGLNCEPHSWGGQFTQAAHLHCELAMHNNEFVELTVPQGSYDLPVINEEIRVGKDGYVRALKGPGLGLTIDEDALNKATVKVLE